MKKRILILGGGISGERSISLKTAKAVKNCIKKKYNCKIVEPDENLTKNIDRFSLNSSSKKYLKLLSETKNV